MLDQGMAGNETPSLWLS